MIYKKTPGGVMPILKISGNYTEVADLLGLEYLYINSDLDTYQKQVKKDLKRTSYFNTNKTVEEMQLALSDITPLDKKLYSYAQGNFTGACFSQQYLSKKHSNTVELASKEGTEEDDFYDSISTAYETDEGKNGGISITYLRDDAEATIPPNKRKRPFILCVIENIMLAPLDRTVTCFINTDLIPEDSKSALYAHGTIIDDSQLSQEIHKTVKQQDVSDIFLTIITREGLINLAVFNEIKLRFKTNTNIDNRDLKRTQLNDLIDFINENLKNSENEHLNNSDVHNYLSQQKKHFSNYLSTSEDANFKKFIHQFLEDFKQLYQINRIHAALIKPLTNGITLTIRAIELELIASNLDEEKKEPLLLQAKLLRKQRADTSSMNEELSLDEHIQAAPITFKMQIECNKLKKSLEESCSDNKLTSDQKEHLRQILNSEIILNFQNQNENTQNILIDLLKFYKNIIENPIRCLYQEKITHLTKVINQSECVELKAIPLDLLNQFVESGFLNESEKLNKAIINKMAADQNIDRNKENLSIMISRLLPELFKHLQAEGSPNAALQKQLQILKLIETIIDWERDKYSESLNTSFINLNLNLSDPILKRQLNDILVLAHQIDFTKSLDDFNRNLDTLRSVSLASEKDSCLFQQGIKIKKIIDSILPIFLDLDIDTQRRLRNVLRLGSDCNNQNSLEKLKDEITQINTSSAEIEQLKNELSLFIELARAVLPEEQATPPLPEEQTIRSMIHAIPEYLNPALATAFFTTIIKTLTTDLPAAFFKLRFFKNPPNPTKEAEQNGAEIKPPTPDTSKKDDPPAPPTTPK